MWGGGVDRVVLGYFIMSGLSCGFCKGGFIRCSFVRRVFIGGDLLFFYWEGGGLSFFPVVFALWVLYRGILFSEDFVVVGVGVSRGVFVQGDFCS